MDRRTNVVQRIGNPFFQLTFRGVMHPQRQHLLMVGQVPHLRHVWRATTLNQLERPAISNMTEKQLVFGDTSSSTIHCRGVSNSLSDICLAIHKVIVDTDREKEIVSRRDRSIPSKIQRYVDSLAIFDARTS